MTKQAVSGWERGKASPEDQSIPDLAKLLDLSVDDLRDAARQNPTTSLPGALVAREDAPSGRIDRDRLDLVTSRVVHELHDALGPVALFELRVWVTRQPSTSGIRQVE